MDQNHMPPPLPEARERSQSESTTSLPTHPPPAYACSPDPVVTSSLSPAPSSVAAPSPKYSLSDDSSTALPPIQHSRHHESNLPSLSSVTGPSLFRESPSEPPKNAMSSPQPSVAHWPSMNPLTQFYTPSHLQQSSPSDSPSRMDIDSPGGSRRGNSVSLDDPDVRMAAEALGDLRADFVSSPPNKHAPLPSSKVRSGTGTPRHGQAEPLLSLLTTAHPSIATTIEGATAAYATSKNFSPRFKSGAEYVEGFVTPVANTVGSVGRAAGVEGGLRWYLKRAARGRRHKPHKDSENEESHKRRKVGKDTLLAAPATHAATPQNGTETAAEPDRRLSIGTVDTLPAYDDVRSPEYTEIETVVPPSSPGQQPLKTRLFMTTSGLGIAMSDESLRRLKYCLRWLRWANGHINQVVENLKNSLDQYDSRTASMETMEAMEAGEAVRERNNLLARITALRNDVIQTLEDAIKTVSKYAAEALPDNARELVRNQLKSMPQRCWLAQRGQDQNRASVPPSSGEGSQRDAATQSRNPEVMVRDGAQWALMFAREGLDMLSQVSIVLDGTIVSAEEWCEKLGRKRRASQELPTTTPAPDLKRPFPEAPVEVPHTSSGGKDVTMSG